MSFRIAARPCVWLPALALMSFAALFAQDSRHVTEPHFPGSCTVLRAELFAPGGRLPGADERRLDTRRIQNAIDACPAGHAVELRSSGTRSIFLIGPLQLRRGVTLLVDAKTAVYASRDPQLYDVTPGSCGKLDDSGHGCKPLILAEDAPGSALMGDGFLDGRGGETLLGESETWWDLARTAKVKDRRQNCMRLLIVRHSSNFLLYHITLRNSPNFHVSVERTNGFTAWGVKIDTPSGARNTDGIDPSPSTNVSILYSWIRDGDDNVAIKAGKLGAATHITVAHDHFYSGHGMSIGSETNGGVSAVRVRDLTIDGADNGIRIKSDRSRGGLVQDVSYDDVCMRRVKNPIGMTPLYTTHGGDLLPEYRDITLSNVHVLTAGHYILDGLDAEHAIEATFNNVFADDLIFGDVRASFADFTLGPLVGNLVPSGADVTMTRALGSRAGTPVECTERFVLFPSDASAPALAESVPPAP